MSKIIDMRNQTVSFEEMIERQNKIRGFDVTAIDKDKFIERIKWKDWSAYFLGEAFYSMYRGHNAKLNLQEVCNLDAEGKNFLFKIMFARDVPNWNCEFLYSIEQEVRKILDIVVNDDGVIVRNRNYEAYKFKDNFSPSIDIEALAQEQNAVISAEDDCTTIEFKDGSTAIVYDDGEITARS